MTLLRLARVNITLYYCTYYLYEINIYINPEQGAVFVLLHGAELVDFTPYLYCITFHQGDTKMNC